MIQPFYSWKFTQEQRTHVNAKIYTQLFVAALFVIAPNWKQPKCPLAGEWINMLCISIQWSIKQQKSQNIDAKWSELEKRLFTVYMWFQNSQKDKCTVIPVKLGVALGEGRLWKGIKDEGLKRKHIYDYMFMVHCDDGLFYSYVNIAHIYFVCFILC